MARKVVEKVVITAENKVSAAAASIKKDFDSVKQAVFSVKGAVLTAVGVGGFGAMTKASADATTEAVNYAQALRMSAQELMAWQHAAKTVNIEGDKMADIFKDVSEKIGDALLTGGGEALDVIEKLNLDLNDLANLSPDQQLLKIAAAMGDVGTQSEKVLILESLASDASLLIPLLDNDAAKLKTLSQEAILTGQALNNVDAVKVKEANDEFKRASSLIDGVGNSVAVELSPYIKAGSSELLQMAANAGGFGNIASSAMDKALFGVKGVLWAVERLQVGWQTLKVGVIGAGAAVLNIFNEIYQAAGETNKLLTSIGLGSKSFAAGAELMDHMTQGFNQSLADEGDALVSMVGNLGKAGDKIDAYVAKVKAAAAESAAVTVATTIDAPVAGAVATGVIGTDEQVAADMAKLDAALMTKEEKIAQHETNSLLTIESAYQQGLLNYTQYEEAKTRFSKQQNDLRKAAAISGVQGALGDIAALTGSKNKKLFKLGKTAAISQALINTYLGVTKTMASVPYPFNIPLAAAQGAAGLFQVAKIRAQSFGGQAHAGLDRAANEGTFVLKRNEMVLDSGTSEKVRNNIVNATQPGEGGGNNFNVNVNMAPDSQISDWVSRNKAVLFNAFTDMMNERTMAF